MTTRMWIAGAAGVLLMVLGGFAIDSTEADLPGGAGGYGVLTAAVVGAIVAITRRRSSLASVDSPHTPGEPR